MSTLEPFPIPDGHIGPLPPMTPGNIALRAEREDNVKELEEKILQAQADCAAEQQPIRVTEYSMLSERFGAELANITNRLERISGELRVPDEFVRIDPTKRSGEDPFWVRRRDIAQFWATSVNGEGDTVYEDSAEAWSVMVRVGEPNGLPTDFEIATASNSEDADVAIRSIMMRLNLAYDFEATNIREDRREDY